MRLFSPLFYCLHAVFPLVLSSSAIFMFSYPCTVRNDGHPDRWIAPSPQVSKLRFFALLKRNITNHHWIGWHRPEQDYGAYDAVMIKCHLSRRNGTVVYRSPLMVSFHLPSVPIFPSTGTCLHECKALTVRVQNFESSHVATQGRCNLVQSTI